MGPLIYIIRYYKKVANLFGSSNKTLSNVEHHQWHFRPCVRRQQPQSPFIYTDAEGPAADGTTYYEKMDVLGADIRSDVYGGGNNAEVTGDTKVKIGRKEEGE